MEAKFLDSMEQLERFLREKERIVIYGIGEYGQCLIQYINEKKLAIEIEAIIVTELSKTINEYEGIQVLRARDYLQSTPGACVVIALSLMSQEEVCEVADRYTQEYWCVTDRLFYQMNARITQGKLKLAKEVDFCIAGFPKCATTSFDKVLREIESVYLPKVKEILFFDWYKQVEEPEEFMARNFFGDVKECQLIGVVEPVSYRYPKETKELLGKEVKFVFIVRNPIKALFSQFKMQTRTGSGGLLVEALYDRCESVEEMFTEYLKQAKKWRMLTPMNYGFWIEQFYEHFPKEQIKIVIFEELVKHPKKVINEIFEYIGIPEKYERDNFPYDNKGDFVFFEKAGYQIARERRILIRKLRAVEENETERKALLEKQLEYVQAQYDAIPKVCDLKMTEGQWNLAKSFFEEDVKALEKMMGRDLVSLWNWYER